MNLSAALAGLGQGLSLWGQLKAHQEAQQIAAVREQNLMQLQQGAETIRQQQLEAQRESFETKHGATQQANRLQEIQAQESAEGKRQAANRAADFADREKLQNDQQAATFEVRGRAADAQAKREHLAARERATQDMQRAYQALQAYIAKTYGKNTIETGGQLMQGGPVDMHWIAKQAKSDPMIAQLRAQLGDAGARYKAASSWLNANPSSRDFSSDMGLDDASQPPGLGYAPLGSSPGDTSDDAADDTPPPITQLAPPTPSLMGGMPRPLIPSGAAQMGPAPLIPSA